MSYVDGFIVAVPKAELEAYKELARKAGSVWKEYGALAYVECVADDVPYGELTSFPRAVMAKVMADPRLHATGRKCRSTASA